VQRFGQNAAVDQGTEIPNHTTEFVQYVADNVDHNIRTLDSNDTFHGMGIIALEHAQQHNVTPIITFEQPLWWKALVIIMSEPLGSDLRKIVLRLGGFHTAMSLMAVLEVSWLDLD